MFSVFALSLYYTAISMFVFVSHPVAYCFLLLLSVSSLLGFLFFYMGFSWYLVLFCLIYVGGVYVLFIFVSVLIPNTSPQIGGSFFLPLAFFSFFFVFLAGFSYLGVSLFCESSHYICSFYEGVSYCFFCLVLLVGFSILSVVVSEKASFFR